MAIAQNHVINIQPGVSAPLVIHCSQGDTGTQINLTVVNGDSTFDCSSYACSVHGTRSDRANWGPFTCNVSGSTVGFSLTSEMTAVAGSCLAEVSIGTVGTANFALLVENATFENGATYSNDVSVYQNILNAVQAGLSLAEAAVTNEKNERIAAVTNEKNERIAAVNAEARARQTADNTLQDNINSEASTRAAADSNLQSQINQIIAPSGEAPSAAEVQNARIGADGVTYDTLGNAIRGQVTDLKSALGDISIIASNGAIAIAMPDLESGSLINGVPVASTKNIRTKDFLQVVKGDEITWEAGSTVTSGNVYFYDENKNYTSVTSLLYNTECQIVTVDNDGYIKVRFDTSAVDNYDGTFSVVSHIKRIASEALDTARSNHDDLLIFANGNDLVEYGYSPVNVVFESGNINLTGGSLVYSSNSARVRTPQDNTPHMKAGTVIGLDSYDDLIYNLYIYNGSSYTDTEWLTSEYTLTTDADVSIVIKNPTERNLRGNTDLLAKHFFAYEPSELLENIENSLNEYGLPKYWVNYLNGVKDSLISADSAVGKYGLQFAFVTDEHLEANAGYSPAILNWLMNNTALRQVVNGGDLLIKNDTKIEALRLLNKWGTETRHLPCINIIGNHDLNTTANSDHPEAHLTRNDIYQTLFGYNEPIETYKFNYGGINGIQDFQQQKIRFIYCDVGAYDALNAWFTDLDNNWTIVVVTHMYWNTSNGAISVVSPNGQDLMNKIVSLIPSMSATIAALICGHTHLDYSADSGYGFPIIATTCDACGVGQPIDYLPRTPGTTSEQAIDLYYINTADKTIAVKRIGAGGTVADRSFTYTDTHI